MKLIEADEHPFITLTLQTPTEGSLALNAGRTPLEDIEVDLWREGSTKDESLFGAEHVHVVDILEALALRRVLPDVLEALKAALAALQQQGSVKYAATKAQVAFDLLKTATEKP